MPTISRNIVISVALALAAAVALFAYARSVQSTASTASDAVNVIVATHEVTAGTSVSTAQANGYLEVRTMHRSDVAPGAQSSFAGISNEVITANMYVGDQLTQSRVGQVSSQSVTYTVTKNHRAVRIPFDPYRGMLLDLQRGDHVDVMTSYRKGEAVYTYLSVPDAMVLQVNPPVPRQPGQRRHHSRRLAAAVGHRGAGSPARQRNRRRRPVRLHRLEHHGRRSRAPQAELEGVPAHRSPRPVQEQRPSVRTVRGAPT